MTVDFRRLLLFAALSSAKCYTLNGAYERWPVTYCFVGSEESSPEIGDELIGMLLCYFWADMVAWLWNRIEKCAITDGYAT